MQNFGPHCEQKWASLIASPREAREVMSKSTL